MILDVANLSVAFRGESGSREVLTDVSLAVQPGDIAVGRTAHGGCAVLHDHPPPPPAVHPVEGEPLDTPGDVEHRSFI